VLPGVRDVYLDPTNRAVKETAAGDWRATAEAVYAGKSDTVAGAKILLIDRHHRLWLRPDSDTAAEQIQMFDGKTWQTRRVSDIPAGEHRALKGIHFIDSAVEDAAGNVWFADGDAMQGWWLHQFTPAGEWKSKFVHERMLAIAKALKKPMGLKFAEPQLIAGADGLFYASWNSVRIDGGPGLGASGFLQFDSDHWSEYFYPPGSSKADNVQSIIPLPDGSVVFVRLIDEPRVVWMSSARSRPAPDLSDYLDRLASLSPSQREAAQAELIAMGPRIRKPLEAVAETARDPEIQSRIPTILQAISRAPAKDVYGGKLKFTSWRLLRSARSGRVYLAVKNCHDLSNGHSFPEALVIVTPEGMWQATESPTKSLGGSIDALRLDEDPAGHAWYRIPGKGVFLAAGHAAPRQVGNVADGNAVFRGADSTGRMYLHSHAGVIALDPRSK
jgi:hypothetical protein